MKKSQIEDVSFEDVQKANNGPQMPKKLKAEEVWVCDPGSTRMGVAVFLSGKLYLPGVVAASGDDVGLRVGQVGAGVRQFYDRALAKRPAPKNVVVVVERPKVYLTGPMAQKVNPRDLMWTAAAMGAFLANIPLACVKEVVELEPADWKGNIDKVPGNIMTLEALFDDEKKKLPRGGEMRVAKNGDQTPYDDNNLLDAVGIGLYYLTRMR